MEELSHQTVDGEFWWQFRNQQLQYGTLWAGGGKTQGEGIAAREQKRPERELDQQWGTQQKPRPSGKEWSRTGWNHEGGTAMARQCWKHNEQENALASSFLLPHSLLPMLPIGQDGQDYQENRTRESENCSSLKCRVNLKKLKEEIGEETGKCHQISYS